MNHWIFVVTSHEEFGLTGEDVFRQRTQDKFWGLGEKTPNRKNLAAGDSIVFYIGNPIRAFSATAVLAGPSFSLSQEEREELSHGKEFYRAQYGVRLERVDVWPERRPIETVLPNLTFIENKKSWGTYLQGGVRSISEQDYRTIVNPVLSTERATESEASSSVSEFALEAHLEDFIDRNWESIDFGRRLARYKTDEQDGRQFPAGAWSIDFLCIDKDTGSLVVVELKRGKSSDSVVGQTLRYVTWVKENLAKPNQETHAIIIVAEADDAMRYAARAVSNLSLLEYRVDFKLSAVQK